MIEVLLVAANEHRGGERRDQYIASKGRRWRGRRYVLHRRARGGRRLLADAADLDAGGARLRLDLGRGRLRSLIGFSEEGDDVAGRAFRSDAADDLMHDAVAKRFHL